MYLYKLPFILFYTIDPQNGNPQNGKNHPCGPVQSHRTGFVGKFLIKLPTTDRWGVLMRKDSPLAEKKTIQPKDLLHIPIITANQAMVEGEFSGWSGGISKKYNVAATYNLLYNASILVEENVGVALCIENIIRDYAESSLCFRPLEPQLKVGLDTIWKKHYVFSKAAEFVLEKLRELV